jgi:uncharacterized protein (TIGR01777 family)
MNAPPGNILVSGASGLIGAALLPALVERGYQVVRLVRSANPAAGQIAWDPAQPLRPQSVSGFEAVVHLAGESVVGRWTEAKKRRILESRVQGTRHLAEALAEAPLRPRVLVSASAIGYYGNRGDAVLTEDSPPGQGFLPEVCGAWERAAEPAERARIRTVQLRIGIVLSRDGGALQKMLAPFRLGAGGNLGDGRQWWSWIDVRDLVGAICHALTGTVVGPVNLVSPRPVTNREFTKTLGAVLSRPAIVPMPAFAARLVFGQMADELLLASQRVEPAKLIAGGYSFEHTELKAALEHNVKKTA